MASTPARTGRHWFQEVLTAVEFIVPAAFFGLADADETPIIHNGELAA